MSIVSSRDYEAVARPEELAERIVKIQSAADRDLALGKSSVVFLRHRAIAAIARFKSPPALADGWQRFRRGSGAAAFSAQEPDGMPVPLGGRLKRMFDVIVASLALFLLMPVMVSIAVAVKLCMGGRVIYRHQRVGFAGETFDCLKFRTMVANAEEVLHHHLATNPAALREWKHNRKLENDPRVTRLGWILRKTSLDELPQLVNIIRGDMSCVGPRPVVTEELDRYGIHVMDYFRVRPGITGSWQVSGRSSVGYDERVLMDVNYVRQWSLAKDFLIILRTIPAALKMKHTA
jgi:exopolysaccharide production protein ExoY